MPIPKKVDYSRASSEGRLVESLMQQAWRKREDAIRNAEWTEELMGNRASISMQVNTDKGPLIFEHSSASNNSIHSEPILMAKAINWMFDNLESLPNTLREKLKDRQKIDLDKYLYQRYYSQTKKQQVEAANKELWEDITSFSDVFAEQVVSVNIFTERPPCHSSCGTNDGCHEKFNRVLPQKQHKVYFAFEHMSNNLFPCQLFGEAVERLRREVKGIAEVQSIIVGLIELIETTQDKIKKLEVIHGIEGAKPFACKEYEDVLPKLQVEMRKIDDFINAKKKELSKNRSSGADTAWSDSDDERDKPKSSSVTQSSQEIKKNVDVGHTALGTHSQQPSSTPGPVRTTQGPVKKAVLSLKPLINKKNVPSETNEFASSADLSSSSTSSSATSSNLHTDFSSSSSSSSATSSRLPDLSLSSISSSATSSYLHLDPSASSSTMEQDEQPVDLNVDPNIFNAHTGEEEEVLRAIREFREEAKDNYAANIDRALLESEQEEKARQANMAQEIGVSPKKIKRPHSFLPSHLHFHDPAHRAGASRRDIKTPTTEPTRNTGRPVLFLSGIRSGPSLRSRVAPPPQLTPSSENPDSESLPPKNSDFKKPD